MAASSGSEYFEIDVDAMMSDPFARPSNAEAVARDEEELQWAAIQRLPSQKRSKFAILARKASQAAADREDPLLEIIDVRKLDRRGRELVVQRALATEDQDNFNLLVGIKERLDRVGLEVPKVEVRFENLNVSANVHMGTRSLPTLVNYVRDILESTLTSLRMYSPQKHRLTILKDVSGAVKPGRMTLLLGGPGSGKSTLLLALAGKLDPNLKRTGNITYNGHALDEFVVQRTAAYISQTDNHIGELTVRETLDFAARCQNASDGFSGYLEDLSRLEKENNIRPTPEIDAFMKAASVGGKKHSLVTDYVLKVLGLDICADTLVGSDMVRGVSGGQRKRVTTGEMIVGPRKSVFMDEISTGLDSSTTYQIVKCMQNFVHQMEATVLMSLLQPPPETFDLFDDLIVLSEGYIIYQGPRIHVLEFFESLGFSLPPRKGLADFLQEVVSRKDQAQYWSDQSKSHAYLPVSRIADLFKQSEYGRSILSNLSSPYDRKRNHPSSLAMSKYAVSKWGLLKACFEREILLISRHRFLYIFRTCQVAFVGVITCTMFLRTRLHPTDEVNGNLYLDVIKPWWVWAFWVSPLSYGQRAISVNEFSATRWKERSVYGNETVGYNVLHSHGLPVRDSWYWIGVGALLAYAVLFNILFTLALAYLKQPGKVQSIIPAESNQESIDDGNCREMKAKGIPEKRLQLLSNVSGVFRPGVLTALVGSSGAGKTTLMDVLAGRKTGGYIEGDIRISGYQKEQNTFARVSGYVEQSDIHSPQVTVEESLIFSSHLRLPKEISKETRIAFVEEVMSLVELDFLRHALVGLPGTTGLSTEQRKRLTIAVELVANPSIIFMDEPTSGLDARAAAIVMRTVRNTVDTGRTVVCTIHQPSIDIFEAFDEGINGVPPIPDGHNPATWMLEISTQACEQRIGQDFGIIYRESRQYREVEDLIQRLSVPAAGTEPLKFESKFSQDTLTQFKLCLWKQNLVYWRSPHYNVVRLFFTTISALILGSVFWNVGSKSGTILDEQRIQKSGSCYRTQKVRETAQDLILVMGALYSACLFLGTNNASTVQPVVSIERTVFYRERATGMYSPLAYAAAQGIVEIPYIAAQTIIYGIITYFMINYERTLVENNWFDVKVVNFSTLYEQLEERKMIITRYQQTLKRPFKI
ncbi:ABC transporter G family member 31 [Acorus calamus]|uniref:ABC transporter G family member 31 n=1 Tax=Acorus calamus TaxID=4465 RepID=A0AAV9EE22_ACOCL|nr:ABC transporter G family member 31 [Acorus calamus]